MTTIVRAATDDEIDDARRLMRALAFSRHARQEDDLNPTEPEPDEAELEAELASLPGRYASPQGCLLVAYEADHPAGCAALCDLGDGVGEVRKIFVAGVFRGQRIGRALLERLLLEARSAGYRRVRFETGIGEVEALHLCECAAFHPVGPCDEACRPPSGPTPGLRAGPPFGGVIRGSGR